MRIRAGLILLLLLVLVAASARIAAPDGTGSGVSKSQGYYVLTNTTRAGFILHAYLSDIGLPINVGDTLLFTWKANNGTGPALYFEIHAHPSVAIYIPYYNITSRGVENLSWTASIQYPYMVYWKNSSNTTAVNLTYSFVLILGQPNYWPLYVAPIGMALVGAAGFITLILARRKESKG
jgi:hypothetical protein